jgi:Zn-dependent M28 family amino/carboxypeptidase
MPLFTTRRTTPLLATGLVLLLCGFHPATLDSTASALDQANRRAGSGFGPEVSAEDFAAHVRVLASDEFGGRAPGSEGEEKTVQYLRGQFERLGLEPGNGDSYFQTVPMVETTADEALSRVAVTSGEQSRVLAFGDDIVIGTRTAAPDVTLADSPLVFVGYGVNAPEQQWNDYAGIDVTGKTVVILINDPGFHAGDETLFDGRRMTYYGRWTYKFEEAARQGAAAAILIHDTDGAGYGWDVVRSSWSGAQFDLRTSDDPEPRLPAQGWISGATAQSLFASAGLDLAAQTAAAGKRGFRAVPMADARLALTLKSHIRESSSRNVIARLRGSKTPDEAIVYTAHWDHLGTHPDEPGDNIYNGAIDNATGVAGVLEIAEAMTVARPAPERSVLFVLVTLEESGLLGSKYYVAHPLVPLANTVAVINIDALPVVGPTRDMVVVGLGNSELDDVLAPIAKKQNRELVPESSPEKGQFFRSDHFSFAKAGVPALYVKGGVDQLEKGRDYGLSVLADYTANRYHKASDNVDPSWDLRGVVQDLNALLGVGLTLARNHDWPNYRDGNAFRAVRDASREPPAH